MPRRRTADLKIDWNKVEAMAQRFIPPELIAQALGLEPIELHRAIKHFQKMKPELYLGMHQAQGHVALVDAQFTAAVTDRKTAAQRWLGINYLGQRHKVDILQKPDGAAPQVAPPVDGFTFVDDAGKVVTVTPGAAEPALPPPPAPKSDKPTVDSQLRSELPEGDPRASKGPGENKPVQAGAAQNTAVVTRSAKDVFNETGH